MKAQGLFHALLPTAYLDLAHTYLPAAEAL
jgi:hypothetical protein